MASAQQSAPHRATGGLNDSPGGFYWVGHEQDRAENAKEKRNFARRSSKAARLQKLKDSIKPFPTGSTTVAHFPRPHTRIAPSIQCGPLDVFPSLSGLTSQNVNTYFYFFKSYTSRTAYPFCASTMTQWHYRIALDQPTLIEILGASGAYSQSWNYARAGYPQHIVEKIGRDALSLKVQAMHSLRTLLNDDRRSTWESTVPIIAQLLFIEVLYTKAKGIHAHLNALKQIANALGGYDNIKNNTLSVFYCAEIVGALANNLSPSFSMASKWENEVKKEFETYLRVNGWPPSSLGSRFFSSPWSKDIPPPSLIPFGHFSILSHTTNQRVI
ncbi:hypothetical protein N7470_006663 [Penicillium chermesinum]|nr:hypothetical protein N7470_006663 [Penicillium chermesinum]